jgi:asparagine synthase (glutamine-hydrolysing)
MCGFVLAYAKTAAGRLPQASFDRMDRAIAHRGPDEHGQINVGPVSIGHRRLAIIDLTGGKQPMLSSDGRAWIAFNGEIYNYREVRTKLENLGHQFREQSDTEVLLAAWQQWGQACLDQLNGMFAFAVYDVEKGTLVAARDRFGEKPLYYCETEHAFYLASELKALLVAGIVERFINHAALYSYFTLGYVVGDQSIIRGIRRLMPGCLLNFSPDAGVVETVWWQPPRPTNEIDDADFVVGQSFDILRDSVRLRMISDVPVGLFLSGGIDSSAVVALAAETAGKQLETFSIGFEDVRYDERPNARFVAERFGTRHHEFVLQPQSIDLLERIAWHADEPFADPAALPTWFLSELTRQHVTVALSGDGGDELFAGYDVYRGHRLSERVRRAPESMRRLAISSLRASRIFGGDSLKRLRLARNIEDAGLPMPERFIVKQQTIFRRKFLADASRTLAPLALAQTDQRLFSALFAPDLDPLGAIALWQQTVSLPDDLLHKVDRMSMAHSLEVRAPFLDHRLFELLNRTTFQAKLKGGRQKYILRKALERYLPADFVWGPKRGFSVPLASWFKGDLAGFIRNQLLVPEAVVQRVIAGSALEQVITEHSRGVRDWSTTLWALLMFEVWCRSYSITAESIVDA